MEKPLYESASQFLDVEGRKAIPEDLRAVFDNKTRVLHPSYSGSREEEAAVIEEVDSKDVPTWVWRRATS
jgi:hypothetical protein